jgi:hypothetical protein
MSQLQTQTLQMEVLDSRITDRRAVVGKGQPEEIAKKIQSGGSAMIERCMAIQAACNILR